jgi:DNA-binding transcriptional LysR family regulator
MQTVLSLVASEAGAAIIPACVSNLRADGVKFLRVVPDRARVELIAAWSKGASSVVLRSFLDMLGEEAAVIREKAKSHLP